MEEQKKCCPSKNVAKWAKFAGAVLIIAAPQIPGIGPVLAANPELSISLVGGLVALLTGEAPAAATKQMAKRVKSKLNGAGPV